MSRLWIIPLALALLVSLIVLAQAEGDGRKGTVGDGQPIPVNKRGNWNKLSPDAARIVESCGTEPPFSGKYLKHDAKGTYTCARCGAPLFPSGAKFDSRSGWPSFDEAIPGSVKEVKDADGRRTEIRCARCDGHLGHVFRGESMTSKNTRHCVNSLSLGFAGGKRSEAFFAGGCFWGVEHLLESVPGVLKAESGYMGGLVKAPTYKQVTSGRSGHAETVRLVFDPDITSYEELARLFFEIHDPTQVGHQGPDWGSQYRSAIFVTDVEQEKTVRELIGILEKKGLQIATEIEAAGVFWPAEGTHQDYYKRTGKAPYCHARVKRF